MKMNKILAVLLSAVMLACMIPAFTLTTSAAVGAITNGDFETGDFTGWDYYTYSTSISSSYKRNGSYGVRIGKDSSLAGHVALEQIVPVNTNATYTLTYYNKRTTYAWSGSCSFSVSVDLGMTPTSFTATGLSATTPSISNSFSKRTHSFSTSTYKYARIRFNAKGSGVDTSLDDISLTATTEGDEGTHAKPALMKFATEYNRPASSSDNLVVQPGFESTTNAQWNTTNFIGKQGVSIATDAGIAHSGSSFLKYSHPGNVSFTEWPMFEVVCPTAGEYVFSAWVRTPLLSATNVGAASIGIIDPDTGKFLTYGNAGGSYDGHYSNTTTQLRSTATDDDWHLRSVVFQTGVANTTVKIGMYGLKSTMYVDDISVHLLSKGVKYTGDQTGTLFASTSVSNKYCESENSLISDSGMTGNVAKKFWTKAASGWNNGFLEFAKDPQNGTRGNTLHFKGTSPASNKKYRYIKFVSVEPNTAYTVSFDYRVVTAGNQLTFIDNNIVKNATFHTPNLGSASNSWKTYAFTFNTGNYNRIGIVFQDGSGEAYFDDFRFFKNSDGISTEPEEELFPTLKPEHPDEFVSRKEMTDDKLGLAFMFNLKSTGVIREDRGFYADYTNGKVEAFEDGVQYTLRYAGAVMTNDATVGQDAALFTRENTNSDSGKTVIDVKADKLYYNPQVEGEPGYGTDIYFAMRIINIPESHISTQIYARPYYVFDYNGREVVVYGDIVNDCYKSYPNINDGWLEWD